MRGAPAIAIVGCLSLSVELQKEEYHDKQALRQDIEGKLNYLVSARPTAVNMKIAADSLLTLANTMAENKAIDVAEMKSRYKPRLGCYEYFKFIFCRFILTIEAMLEKDISDNQAIGKNGANAIFELTSGENNLRVLTHCNTGSLATAGHGTALGVIRALHELKRLGTYIRCMIYLLTEKIT